MNIHYLAHVRALCAARMIELDGFDTSTDPQEREAYTLAERAYLAAEESFQRAISTLTEEELEQLGVAA